MASFMASPNAGSATGDFMEIEISIHCRDLQKVRQSPSSLLRISMLNLPPQMDLMSNSDPFW